MYLSIIVKCMIKEKSHKSLFYTQYMENIPAHGYDD